MLEHKGVEVHEISVSGGTPGWDAMITRTGGRTTPQILINGEVIGGYNELAVLNAQGILDDKLGLAHGEERETLYEVIIIGSGPAGMTAAIYCARKGLKTLVLSKDVGGQLNWSAELENYLGYSYIEAPDLINRFEEHVERFDITRVIGEEVVNLEIADTITAFAMDVLALNAYGEIVIDCQTRTGAPGVFAAGDVTEVRDKQVLVAAGEGVKAALRAHEYLLAGR